MHLCDESTQTNILLISVEIFLLIARVWRRNHKEEVIKYIWKQLFTQV